MAESNISRDHIAMEAMKVFMEKNVTVSLTLKNRIRRFLGMSYKSVTALDHKAIAKFSYGIADLKIRSTTAATIASVVGVISFFINITSGNNKIKYIFCFIGAFILGVLLSDPAKNLVKRLLKEE